MVNFSKKNLIKIVKIDQFWNGASSRFFKSCAGHRNENDKNASRETRAKIDGQKFEIFADFDKFSPIFSDFVRIFPRVTDRQEFLQDPPGSVTGGLSWSTLYLPDPDPPGRNTLTIFDNFLKIFKNF